MGAQRTVPELDSILTRGERLRAEAGQRIGKRPAVGVAFVVEYRRDWRDVGYNNVRAIFTSCRRSGTPHRAGQGRGYDCGAGIFQKIASVHGWLPAAGGVCVRADAGRAMKAAIRSSSLSGTSMRV